MSRRGDVIDLTSVSDVTFADYKDNLKGAEYYDKAESSRRIFDGNRAGANPGEYEVVARSLLDSWVLH